MSEQAKYDKPSMKHKDKEFPHSGDSMSNKEFQSQQFVHNNRVFFQNQLITSEFL